MLIPSALPVKSVGPEMPKAPSQDNPLTRLCQCFVSATNAPMDTRLLAVFGNVKAGIRLAALRGETGKLQAFHEKAANKHKAANGKLSVLKEVVVKASAREKDLRGYDRGIPMSYSAQKAHNENVARHEQARDGLQAAKREVVDQEKAVDRYRGRMALALQSLRNLGVEI